MKHKKTEPSINVAVRMRPILSKFEDDPAWIINSQSNSIISISRQNLLQKTPKKRYVQVFSNYKYNFDYVFGNDDSTKSIYDQCCLQMINGFLQGQNSTIFMYGQTTSGKTYTMLGDNNYQGLITFSLKDIFKKFSQFNSSEKYKIAISYLEIYNQQINDLLNPGSVNLKVQQDSVQGLKQCQAGTFQQAQQLLLIGEEQRSYKQKSMHDHSSRSHTIFQIRIYDLNNGKNRCCLNLVDLAGSERLTDQDRLNDSTEQTGYINKSLFVLSNVISKLAKSNKKTHIPFRDSKLTRLLSNSLIGRSNTLVICTISPAAMNFYQTLSTLRFATNAKKVQLHLVASQDSFDKQNRDKDSVSSKQYQSMKEQMFRLRKLLKQSHSREQTLKQQLQQSINFTKYHSQSTKDTHRMGVSEKQFLCKLKQQIQEKMPTIPILWVKKSSDLCLQYSKNIDILQYKYKMALFNVAESECSQSRAVSEVIKEKSNIQIFEKIRNKQIFNGLAVSALLNIDCDAQVSYQQLKQAHQEAKKILCDKFDELRHYLVKRQESVLLNYLQKQYDQKLHIIDQAFRNVCKVRGLSF